MARGNGGLASLLTRCGALQHRIETGLKAGDIAAQGAQFLRCGQRDAGLRRRSQGFLPECAQPDPQSRDQMGLRNGQGSVARQGCMRRLCGRRRTRSRSRGIKGCVPLLTTHLAIGRPRQRGALNQLFMMAGQRHRAGAILRRLRELLRGRQTYDGWRNLALTGPAAAHVRWLHATPLHFYIWWSIAILASSCCGEEC